MKTFDIPARARRAALILCPLLCLVSPTSAVPEPGKPVALPDNVAIPIRGELRLRITSLTERIDSFTILSQGKLQETGPVVLTLDPAYRRSQTLVLDFDKREIRIDTRLLINAPLLKRHNAPATPIAVSERGRLTIKGIVPSRNHRTLTIDVDIETTSSGTITTGPLAGAAYRNRKHCVDCCSWPAPGHRRIVLNVGGGGNVVGIGAPGSLSHLVCAADQGTFSFGGRESKFTGFRRGTVAP